MTLSPSPLHLLIYSRDFPNLLSSNWVPTSCPDPLYNCIAWAANDTKNWWWPNSARGYWPQGAPDELTLGAFVAAFTVLGFEQCSSRDPEYGYSKIAIYVDGKGTPKHAARQLKDGYWSSKLGEEHDIRHEFHALDGLEYGTAKVIMERPKNISGPIIRWIINLFRN